VTENGKPVAARVLLYSEEYPKSSLDYWEDEGNAVFSNLRPGAYRVVAVKGLQDVEFRDAVSVQKYLSSGKEVNLRAGDKAKVRVEVLAREEE